MLLATVQVLSAAIDYTRTVTIPGWIHQLLSFHIKTLKIGKFSPIVATRCWPVGCQQAFYSCWQYSPVCRKNKTTGFSLAIPLLLSMHLSASNGAWICIPSPFEPTAVNVTATVRHKDHRRIICYFPQFRSYQLLLIRHEQFQFLAEFTSC